MSRLQIAVVALCIALNAVDGFDVLAISFAAPGIAAEWSIDRATLGAVLSMELLGMAAGSVLIGNLADRIGRRPVILGCLAVMAVGMFLAAWADGVATLSATRLVTGLGIGGMLSSTSAMVAEFSNARRRSLNVVLNIAGYSAGAIVGGVIAAALLERTGQWRSVFLVGAAATTALLPLALLFLPESIDSQIARRPDGALDKVNRTLRRLRLPPAQRLPAPPARAERPSILALFSSGHAAPTVLLTVAYFAQIMAFYFIQKWTPKVIVDMGFEAASAGRVLVCANIGCLLGALAVGLASQRFRLQPLVVGSMLLSFAAIAGYGLVPRELGWLAAVAALAGFFTNAGVVGMYPVLVRVFPAPLRASGTGFVIGVGRGGSAVGPMLAGALFAGGSALVVVSTTMGAGALVAASMLLALQRQRGRRIGPAAGST
ncbi:MFS transporter [Pseudoxanthomonas broegbernensis]|uniref:MFS transporter n=2 Tax=Pseudoxanthomonas broegbernensis TaxID=83619 RepID=A0A7V8GMY7_9GAMM|nr:MFS transporter [Pseudoxanthomonas broegbernensis]KAF1686708.1 MFS transporter [Pseudoxanthomonas broegbernensis]